MPQLPKVTITQRTTAPLLKAERPYEEFFIGWLSVLRINGQWHMWYDCGDRHFKEDGDRYVCYATSNDGARWARPNLGLVDYGGNKNNNIILSGLPPEKGFAGFTVFTDDQAAAEERFKAVFQRHDKPGEWWVRGAISGDGLHWKILEKPLLKKNSDTQTVCIRDPDCYRLYSRMWSGALYQGYRQVGYSESKTFGNFPDPEVILAPDDKDPKNLHFYNSAATKLSKNLYVMFPGGYSTGEDVVRSHVALSRDGKNFQRVGREAVLGLGKTFDSKAIYVAPGAIPAEKPGTFWIYYTGTEVRHDDNVPSKAKFAGGFGRFLLTVAE